MTEGAGGGAFHAGRPARGDVALPPGKSHAIRALFLAAQARGKSRVGPLPISEDVERALDWLVRGGVLVHRGGDGVELEGRGAGPRATGEFDAGESGAVLRMGLAWLASGEGKATVRGSAGLARRPLAEGLESLRALGARIEGDALPLTVTAAGLRGGSLRLDPVATSQFASGLLLAAPSFVEGIALDLPLDPPSADYLAETLAALGEFGVPWRERRSRGRSRVEVPPGAPRGTSVSARPDPSHTLLFACVPAILGGEVRLRGLVSQRERGIAALVAAGVRVEPEPGGIRLVGPLQGPLALDGEPDPDLLPPLLVAALFAPGPSRFRGLARLRHKESDRLGALRAAIDALGGRIDEEAAGEWLVFPPSKARAVVLRTRGDHRLAMAFGLAALAVPGARPDDSTCVAKSMGDYWQRLAAAVGGEPPPPL